MLVHLGYLILLVFNGWITLNFAFSNFVKDYIKFKLALSPPNFNLFPPLAA